uniref:Nicotinamide riboside kinase 1 n=1 Tax=Cyprinus carpio TaxID=7962 RepID=A0A8C1L7W3_CYPCA
MFALLASQQRLVLLIITEQSSESCMLRLEVFTVIYQFSEYCNKLLLHERPLDHLNMLDFEYDCTIMNSLHVLYPCGISRPVNTLFNKRYFLQLPYEICKKRRSSRVYVPYPDPPSYSDGYVWPLYLKNRKALYTVFLDGTQKSETLLSTVLVLFLPFTLLDDNSVGI